VKSLVIFNLNVGVLSYCHSQYFHIDYSEGMAGNVWTVVIALILVGNTNPELIVESSHTEKKVSMKYDFDNIVIFGPSTIHSTAPDHYSDDAFRVCLFLSVAHITKGNIDVLLEDVTSLFPSKNDKALLLRWSRNQPHWKCIHNVISTNIPTVPDTIIFGARWCKMFDILVSLKSSNDNIAVSPDVISFCQWVSLQRHYYALKYSPQDTISDKKTEKSQINV
jgi:hypothetical protein